MSNLVPVSSFLSRASAVRVTATPDFNSMTSDGANPQVVKIFQKLSAALHGGMKYAQHEEEASTSQCGIRATQGSESGSGETVFTVEDMLNIAKAISALSKLDGLTVETYIDPSDRAHPELTIAVRSD